MASLQTVEVSAIGGLDMVSPPQVLAAQPGLASVLNNYEALPKGGYRKVKGFYKYSDLPDAYDYSEIRGIAYYKGLVVVVGNDVLHSPDANTWYVVNKKAATKVQPASMATLEVLPRTGTGPVEFSRVLKGSEEVLVITDDRDTPSMLHVKGDFYTYTVSDNDDAKGLRFCTKYQDHVVYAGSVDKPGLLVVSDRFDPLGFSGTGAWTAQVNDEIVGLHTFRDFLYIFCRSAIYRVINLESKGDVAIRPVTTKIGCVDGRTIREIGGDIVFLADDGLRYLGATERIDDVSLNTVSDKVKPLITDISLLHPINSVVLPDKAQYRLFFTDTKGTPKGLIGTLMERGEFNWATTDDMYVTAISASTAETADEIYHVGSPSTGVKRVYAHDKGDTFDGTPFSSTFTSTTFNVGDSSVRKNLHAMELFLDTEDRASIYLEISYDHGTPLIIQPEPFHFSPVIKAARWGEDRWGEMSWGAVKFPVDLIFLEGSGKWLEFTFRDLDDNQNATYTIRGYNLQLTPGGRI